MRKFILALVFALSVAVSFVRAGHADDAKPWAQELADYKVQLHKMKTGQLYRERDHYFTAGLGNTLATPFRWLEDVVNGTNNAEQKTTKNSDMSRAVEDEIARRQAAIQPGPAVNNQNVIKPAQAPSLGGENPPNGPSDGGSSAK